MSEANIYQLGSSENEAGFKPPIGLIRPGTEQTHLVSPDHEASLNEIFDVYESAMGIPGQLEPIEIEGPKKKEIIRLSSQIDQYGSKICSIAFEIKPPEFPFDRRKAQRLVNLMQRSSVIRTTTGLLYGESFTFHERPNGHQPQRATKLVYSRELDEDGYQALELAKQLALYHPAVVK